MILNTTNFEKIKKNSKEFKTNKILFLKIKTTENVRLTLNHQNNY